MVKKILDPEPEGGADAGGKCAVHVPDENGLGRSFGAGHAAGLQLE